MAKETKSGCKEAGPKIEKDPVSGLTYEIDECACTCGEGKTKVRDPKEYKDLLNRLSRIEGQVRGVKRMVEEDYYCVDIMTQVSAINAALKSFNLELLDHHINSCVVRDIREGKDDVTDELMTLLKKLMK